MIRTLSFFLAAALTASAAAPAWAGTRADAPLAGGPFALAGQPARGAIFVVETGAACDAAGAAAQAALAAAAGKAVGVVAQTGKETADVPCAAARTLAGRTGAAGPAIAFADGPDAFGAAGAPDRWLAERRQRGVYVWDLEAWRRLSFAGPREVLGLFAPAADRPAPSLAEMMDAAISGLERSGQGWFLLVQADALDAEAQDALRRAGRAGARVIAADGTERYSALTAD